MPRLLGAAAEGLGESGTDASFCLDVWGPAYVVVLFCSHLIPIQIGHSLCTVLSYMNLHWDLLASGLCGAVLHLSITVTVYLCSFCYDLPFPLIFSVSYQLRKLFLVM